MRKIAILLVLVGLVAVAPQGFTQENRESATQERRERQQRVQRDVPADLQRARQALESAQRELQAAGDQWGGHRVAAMTHVGQALDEIKCDSPDSALHTVMSDGVRQILGVGRTDGVSLCKRLVTSVVSESSKNSSARQRENPAILSRQRS